MDTSEGIVKVTHLEVKMNPFTDVSDLMNELSKLKEYDFSVYAPDEGLSFEQTREWLAKTGLTDAFYGQKTFQDIGRITQRPSDIVPIIHKFLDRVIYKNRLLILDRFLFPDKHDKNYSSLFVSIIEKYLPILNEITIITKPQYNTTIKNEISNLLHSKKPSLKIHINHSDLFHDRFWISDFDGRGLILGTSLNGFGKKYAVVDYLNSDDVKVIVQELKTLNLI